MIRACIVIALCAGCLSSGSIVCDDGRLCPAGTVCDDTHAKCLQPSQQGCSGTGACTVTNPDDGVCVDGWCLRRGCGDTLIEPGEQCDGTAFAPGVSCKTIGYYDDIDLRCSENCTVDPSGCSRHCGDGKVDPEEDCEPNVPIPPEVNCQSLHFYDPGPVTCDPDRCVYLTTACTGYCGDEMLNGPELCDGSWGSALECVDYGFDAGAVSCADKLCVAAFDRCAMLGWKRVAGAPSGFFTGIGGASPNDVWLVGGTLVYHWDGHGWKDVDAQPNGLDLSAVWVADTDDAWIVGAHAQIRRWNGTTWEPETNPVQGMDLASISGTSANDVWAVGAQGTVIHRDANGWQRMNGYGLTSLSSVWARPGDVWIVGFSGVVYHNGTIVDIGTTESLAGVWASGPDDVWIAESDTLSLHHWDGKAWRVWTDDIGGHSAVWGSGPRDVYTIAPDGEYSHFDGAHWIGTKDGATAKARAVFGFGVGDVWVAGATAARYAGRAMVFPGGKTVDAYTSSLAGTGIDNLWASSTTGDLYFFDGADWVVTGASAFTDGWGTDPSRMFFADGQLIEQWDGAIMSTTSVTNGVAAVWGSGPDDVWAMGMDVMHWDGVGWSAIEGPPFVVADIWGSGPTNVWAVGGGGGIAHWDGDAWKSYVSPTTRALHGVWGSSAKDVWAAGDNGALAHFDGDAWSSQDVPAVADTLTTIAGTAPDDIWAVSDRASIYHYDGVSWTPVRNTLAPETQLVGLIAEPRHIFLGGTAPGLAFDRVRPWSCRAHERACGDGVDDDCDGAIDGDDGDCKDVVRLSQVAMGDVPLLEVVNRTSDTIDLDGLTIAFHLDCNQFVSSYRFGADAQVAGNQTFRAVVANDLLERERYLATRMCKSDEQANGWYALCAGPCDLSTCDGMIDYVQIGTGGSNPPACAIFSPAPVDSSSATAGQGVVRTSFSSGGKQGAASDWAILPISRK